MVGLNYFVIPYKLVYQILKKTNRLFEVQSSCYLLLTSEVSKSISIYTHVYRPPTSADVVRGLTQISDIFLYQN